MSNPAVLRQFKQQGQTPSKVLFDGITPMNWVVDISRALRGIWIDFAGELLTSGGTTDPNVSTDTFLKILGTIQVTLNTDNGDIDIVPAGTRVFEYYQFMKQLQEDMMRPSGLGGVASTQQILVGGDGYLNVTGKSANSPEMFGLRLWIPFQYIGGESAEKDFAMLVPRTGDQTLTVTITPVDITSTFSHSLTSPYSPFPNSDRTYSIKDTDGTSTAYAFMYLDQVEKVIDGVGMGKWLPRIQVKQLITAASAGVQTDVQLTNWERGGLWHAAAYFETNQLASSGAQLNLAILDTPGSTGSPNSQTIMRKMTWMANTERLLEDNLQALIAQQHPIPDKVLFGSGLTNDAARLPHRPIIQNFAKGQSAFGLYDFSPYIASNQQINLNFDTLAANSTGVDTIDVMVLRYQPRG